MQLDVKPDTGKIQFFLSAFSVFDLPVGKSIVA
jgi:hypothetical protein